jgi:hypothetical protein
MTGKSAMKKINQLIAATLFAVVVGFGAVSYAQSDYQGYATVVRVQGMASYTLGDGAWHPLLAGKKLMAGSTIRTADNGIVDVILGKQIDFPQTYTVPDRITPAPDSPVRGLISDRATAQQNAIRLTPGTVLAINKLNMNDTGVDTVSDTELDLQQGKIFGTVKKLNAASQYLVKIPNGIAGIRGTEYELGADDSCACFSSESGGLTLVLSGNGQTIQFNITPGQMVLPGGGSNNGNGGGTGSNNGGTIPITPEIETLLSNVFTALNTTYHLTVSFNYDPNANCQYISSLTGAKVPSKIVVPPLP